MKTRIKKLLAIGLSAVMIAADASSVVLAQGEEFGTEIMKVKDGRDAIYSITMDDGYGDSTEKFYRPWFEKYNLRGTGLNDGILTEKEKVLLRENYYAVRTGTRGYNNLDMTDDDFQNVKVQGVLGKSGTNWTSTSAANDGETAESMNKWLDTAVTENKWLVEMWHSVCWDDGTGSAYTSDGGYRPIQDDIGEDHIKYASRLQNEGKIWVAKFDDAVRYIKERQSAVLSDNSDTVSRTVTFDTQS